MIKVFYNKTEEELSTIEEVIILIKKINEEKLVDKQLVVVETEGSGVMELGLGMGDESVIFYIPNSEEEDVIVSCNELVDRAKTENLPMTHVFDELVECTTCNVVSFENAIFTLEAFLQGKEFINFVDWYSY